MPNERIRRKEREKEVYRQKESLFHVASTFDFDNLETKTLVRRLGSYDGEWREETPGSCEANSSRCFMRGEDLVHRV